jgi:PAS domain S-box-containing protein
MNGKKLHVLLAEAHPDETASALRALYPEGHDGLELTNVSSVSTLIATLEIVKPEVIFLDLSLAHSDPLAAVRRVHRSAPEVPLIVLADGKQAQDTLADSETRGRQQFAELNLLYRSLPVALAVFGCDMRFLRVNDEVAKFDGLPAAAHIGLTLREVAPDFANAVEGYLRKVFQTGGVRLEHRTTRRHASEARRLAEMAVQLLSPAWRGRSGIIGHNDGHRHYRSQECGGSLGPIRSAEP